MIESSSSSEPLRSSSFFCAIDCREIDEKFKKCINHDSFSSLTISVLLNEQLDFFEGLDSMSDESLVAIVDGATKTFTTMAQLLLIEEKEKIQLSGNDSNEAIHIASMYLRSNLVLLAAIKKCGNDASDEVISKKYGELLDVMFEYFKKQNVSDKIRNQMVLESAYRK